MDNKGLFAPLHPSDDLDKENWQLSEFKYLDNTNNKSLISRRVKNVYNKILAITAIYKEKCIKQYEIHVLIRLYHAIFLITLLFNCQTWTRIRKYNIDTLTVVQLKYLKQALRVPYSTPNVVVCLEMGLLSIEYVIEIRRFVYLHHILMSISDEPVKKPILSAVRVSIRRKLGKWNTSSSKTIQHSRRSICKVII